jgi:hypothetical protein
LEGDLEGLQEWRLRGEIWRGMQNGGPFGGFAVVDFFAPNLQILEQRPICRLLLELLLEMQLKGKQRISYKKSKRKTKKRHRTEGRVSGKLKKKQRSPV